MAIQGATPIQTCSISHVYILAGRRESNCKKNVIVCVDIFQINSSSASSASCNRSVLPSLCKSCVPCEQSSKLCVKLYQEFVQDFKGLLNKSTLVTVGSLLSYMEKNAFDKCGEVEAR